MDYANKPAVTICGGVQGTGKSTFALRYLVNAPLDVRFIFDPEEEYSERLHLKPASTRYELDMQLLSGWVVFDPHGMFCGRLAVAFDFFCEWAFSYSERIPGRKLLVVDEAWKYLNTQKHPVELEACVRSGRKRGLDCLFNTQTPNLLHSTVRNECSELVCFRLFDDNCLKFPTSRGFNADEIKSLPDLHFISRSTSGGELRGAITI